MSTHSRTFAAALAATLLTTASAAGAQMYRWIDEQGSVTYSNQLPPPDAKVREVTPIDDGSRQVSPSEKRTLEILDAEQERQKGRSAAREPSLAPGTLPADAAGAIDVTPTIGIAPTQPEAVRDPCLRSADPKCIEKNRAAYVPYRGYSPSASTMTPALPVGAGSGAGAGGSVGGGSGPVKLTAPKSSTYALPPGSELPAKR
jgi:hypothetical protein